MPFTIIAEACTGCSACEKRCPTGAISGESKKVYFIEPGAVHRLRRLRRDLPRRSDHDQPRRDHPRAQARRASGRRGASGQLQRMRRVRRRMPIRMHLAVAGKQRGLSRQGAGQRKDLRRMPAMRRGLRMGRYLHNAHRAESGIPRSRSAIRVARKRPEASSTLPGLNVQEPALGSALCFRCAAIAMLFAHRDAPLSRSRRIGAELPRFLPKLPARDSRLRSCKWRRRNATRRSRSI